MKRTILVGLLLLAVAAVSTLSRAGTLAIAQADATPANKFGIHWDRYSGPIAVGKPELITLHVDLEVRCDETVAISQTLNLDGPAPELGAGLFREYDWDWGGWEPPVGMACTEWQRVRWEVPEEAGAYDILEGEMLVGQVYGEYWPPEGRETQEDADHFWLLGLLDDGEPTPTPEGTVTATPTSTPTPAGEWYDSCPGAPDCETPGPTPTEQPTLTPRPTHTPEPTPPCLPTPTCPPVGPTHTPYPSATAYPTSTPWPTQPPFS